MPLHLLNTVVGVTLSLCAAVQAQQGPRRPPPPAPVIPDTVFIERDVDYAGTGNPSQTLDVLTPRQAASDKPRLAIISIHGGAFMFGDKSMGLDDIVPLVASGEYVGVTINYRLSGEAIWPAQVHDCKGAIRWVRANAAKYHIDPERIGVIGGSAGGNLASMVGLTGGRAELEGDVGQHLDTSSGVACVVNMFGPADLVALPNDGSKEDHASADSPEGRLLGGEVRARPEQAKAASPITYVSKAAPPFLIIHGSEDPIIPHVQSERLHKAMKDAGAEAYFITVTGGGHGGWQNPEVAARVKRFFDKVLRGRSEVVDETAVPATMK